MKKSLIIILAILVLLLLVVIGIFIFASSHATNSGQVTNGGTQGTTFPGSGTVTQTSTNTNNVIIKETTGQSILVPDFIHNGQTMPDKNSPGTYQLLENSEYCQSVGDCTATTSNSDFSISYDEKYNFFNITLYTEPLEKSRQEAEQFLSSDLKLSPQQLCNLNYSVGTISAVNSTYGGEELDFSSCPNAVQLPSS